MKDQPLRTVDDVIAEIAGIPIEELAREQTGRGRHLISVDELRAAGALDVPPAWRKSLGGEPQRQRDLFSDLIDDDGSAPQEQPSTPRDPACDGSADELC